MTFIEFLIKNNIVINGLDLENLLIESTKSNTSIIIMQPTGNIRIYKLDRNSIISLTTAIHAFLEMYLDSFNNNVNNTIHKIIFDIEDNLQNVKFFNSIGLNLKDVNHVKLLMNYIKPKIKVDTYDSATAIPAIYVNTNEKPYNTKHSDKFIAFVYKISLNLNNFNTYLKNNYHFHSLTDLDNSKTNFIKETEVKNSNMMVYIKFDFRLIDLNATEILNKNNEVTNSNFQNNYIVVSRRIKPTKLTNNKKDKNPNLRINVRPTYDVYQLYCISIHQNI